MNNITLKAHAKLNLFLDILGKKENFHEVNFINCELDLHDKITLEVIDEDKILIESDNPNVPTDEKNFCFIGAQLLKEKFKIKKGIKIKIEKKIPFIGGLGGGSADLGQTLIGMNKLFNLNLSEKELIDIARPISTDACFSIVGGTARVQGIGEKIKKINPIEKHHIILINPNTKTPDKKTAWMYNNYDSIKQPSHGYTDHIINAIHKGKSINKYIFNAFEQIPIPEYKEAHKIIKMLRENYITSTLCGSGPTVFGISKDKELLKSIKTKYPTTITHTI